MDEILSVLCTDVVTGEVMSDEETIERLALWRDRARRHGRMDEAAFYSRMLIVLRKTQVLSDGITNPCGRGIVAST